MAPGDLQKVNHFYTAEINSCGFLWHLQFGLQKASPSSDLCSLDPPNSFPNFQFLTLNLFLLGEERLCSRKKIPWKCQTSFYFHPRCVEGLHFPVSCAFTWTHVNVFWPLECISTPVPHTCPLNSSPWTSSSQPPGEVESMQWRVKQGKSLGMVDKYM